MLVQVRHKTLHGSPWRQSPVRGRPRATGHPAATAVNPDAEVHQIMSSAATGPRRRPVVRYGQDLLSPGNIFCPSYITKFFIVFFLTHKLNDEPFMALIGPFCANVPLRNYFVTDLLHPLTASAAVNC